MQKVSIRLRLALIISLLLTIGLVVVRIIFLKRYIDPQNGLYVYGTNADLYFSIALVAVMLIIFAFSLPLAKSVVPERRGASSSLTIFVSCFCGFMCISAFITDLVALTSGTSQLTNTTIAISSGAIGNSTNVLRILQIIFSLPSAIYFLSLCMKKPAARSASGSILAMAPIVYTGIRLIILFLDTHTAINSSERTLSILSYCSILLFFLCEVRFTLPELPDKKAKSPESLFKYTLFGLSTILFTCVSVIPILLLSAFWILKQETSYAFSILNLSFAFYAAARLFTVIQLQKAENK